METVKAHYDGFLGSVYSWIIGDFDKAYRQNVEFFKEIDLAAEPGDLAVDLGSGPGCQSIPLAEAGYDVTAIDFCEDLLEELRGHAGELDISTVCGDILEFDRHLPGSPTLIVCMGDTLVHLPDPESVRNLVASVCSALRPGGTFIYSIRDYVNYVPRGADRFIPIRADDEQIFTCFLDYGDDVVHVHDVLYRKVDGEWQMRISDYLKLRLDSDEINRWLAAGGLAIDRTETRDGMITVVARKPD